MKTREQQICEGECTEGSSTDDGVQVLILQKIITVPLSGYRDGQETAKEVKVRRTQVQAKADLTLATFF